MDFPVPRVDLHVMLYPLNAGFHAVDVFPEARVGNALTGRRRSGLQWARTGSQHLAHAAAAVVVIRRRAARVRGAAGLVGEWLRCEDGWQGPKRR